MLRLAAAHLREELCANPQRELVWLDIGGGTGWNVEELDKYFDVKQFKGELGSCVPRTLDLTASRVAVYVLDLCEPLLDVAQARFEKRGWTHVQCLLQDATEFTLPGHKAAAPDSLDFVTMSYSFS